MTRKNKNNMDALGCCDEEENQDICGFSETPITDGNCISSFSFDDSTNLKEVNLSTNNITNTKFEKNSDDKIIQKDNNNSNFFDNRKTPIANGAAPAIDGETPNIRRCYILRESTIRKINELKMMDNDINVCVSTIVDLAIDYYHKYITNNNY